MRIDPRLIIEFAAIAQEGSYTRAAQRLRVAQPWLSARVHKLEELLGFRLLDRTTRSVSLTERGAEFFPVACSLAEASEAADKLALQLRRSSLSVLRIGAAPYTKIIRQRRELIDAFATSNPNVHLELETGWSLALLGRLDAGEIDLTFMMGEVDVTRFEGIPLKHFGVALTMSRDHLLAGARSLPVGALADQRIQVFTRSLNPQLWDLMHAPLISAGCQFIEIPEMAEGAPNQMDSPTEIAAFFDFGADDVGAVDVVRVPLAAPANIPFRLLRRFATPSPAAQSFWELALSSIK